MYGLLVELERVIGLDHLRNTMLFPLLAFPLRKNIHLSRFHELGMNFILTKLKPHPLNTIQQTSKKLFFLTNYRKTLCVIIFCVCTVTYSTITSIMICGESHGLLFGAYLFVFLSSLGASPLLVLFPPPDFYCPAVTCKP
jgi:hypothetical protein